MIILVARGTALVVGSRVWFRHEIFLSVDWPTCGVDLGLLVVAVVTILTKVLWFRIVGVLIVTRG